MKSHVSFPLSHTVFLQLIKSFWITFRGYSSSVPGDQNLPQFIQVDPNWSRTVFLTTIVTQKPSTFLNHRSISFPGVNIVLSTVLSGTRYPSYSWGLLGLFTEFIVDLGPKQSWSVQSREDVQNKEKGHPESRNLKIGPRPLFKRG